MFGLFVLKILPIEFNFSQKITGLLFLLQIMHTMNVMGI